MKMPKLLTHLTIWWWHCRPVVDSARFINLIKDDNLIQFQFKLPLPLHHSYYYHYFLTRFLRLRCYKLIEFLQDDHEDGDDDLNHETWQCLCLKGWNQPPCQFLGSNLKTRKCKILKKSWSRLSYQGCWWTSKTWITRQHHYLYLVPLFLVDARLLLLFPRSLSTFH